MPEQNRCRSCAQVAGSGPATALLISIMTATSGALAPAAFPSAAFLSTASSSTTPSSAASSSTVSSSINLSSVSSSTNSSSTNSSSTNSSSTNSSSVDPSVGASASTAPAAGSSPDGTTVAVVRDLSATLSADAVVRSAGDSVVIHGRCSTVPVAASATDADGATTTGAASAAQPASPPAASAAQPAQQTKTLTGLAAVGTRVRTGTEVYAADGEPVVAILAGTPSWRTLKVGVSTGSDVRTLEKALLALGFGDNLTVDNRFTSATAHAVRQWEKSLHRRDPDGEVSPDEIVLVGASSRVSDHGLQVGDPAPAGAQVLSVAGTERVISASVPAEHLAAWTIGATVTVRWSDGTTFAGRVTSVSRDIDGNDAAGTAGNGGGGSAEGTAEVTVVPTHGKIKRRTGSTAEVELVTRRRAEVIAVPVAALHDGPSGRPAVTVIKDGVDTARPVGIGLVAQGWAEVTSGLQAGERVRLPGD